MSNNMSTTMRRPVAFISLVVLVVMATCVVSASDQLPVVRVGVVTDGPIERQDTFLDFFRKEIEGVAAGIYELEFPTGAVVDGGWNKVRIADAVDELSERADVDVIVAVGIGVSSEVCSRAQTKKPLVVPFAFGGCESACLGSPEIRTQPIDIGSLMTRDLEAFHQTVQFKEVVVLIDSTWSSQCALQALDSALVPGDVRMTFVSLPAGTDDVLPLLPSDTDAVYLMPLLQLDDTQFGALVHQLTNKGLPTFSMIGESEVEQGVLAGMNTKAAMAAMARSSALQVLDLIEGRRSQSASAVEAGGRLTLNLATAQELGFSPSWDLFVRAQILHDRGLMGDRPISLKTAIDRAVAANLDLAVEDRRVAAGAENVREAKSNYRPHIDLGLAGAAIDENHAIGALGQYARYAAGSLTLTQLIYSDGASGKISIEQDLQQVREFDRQALRFDIARDAVAAYMSVMRSDALVRIRKEQVELTRANLELAAVRRSVGAAGAAESYRWEAELASARAGLLEAMAVHRRSERQLSRLLAEPLTTRWDAEQPDITTALEVLGGADEVALLDTPDGYDRLTSTLMTEGLVGSPELAALEAAISARERTLVAAKRASYAPVVALKADISQVLAKDRTGGLDLGEIGELIPEFDDTSWQVGMQAGLPVVTGGANKARRIRAQEELFALQVDSKNIREKLGQRILSALDASTASWSTIALRQQAADASARTQELVHDAYARGAASIIDLLDAQNNALSSDLAAATAMYDFFDDWAEVRRSVAELPGVVVN